MHIQIIHVYDLEVNFAQIHLHNWQFYLPWVVGQWDMSIPLSCGIHLKAISQEMLKIFFLLKYEFENYFNLNQALHYV